MIRGGTVIVRGDRIGIQPPRSSCTTRTGYARPPLDVGDIAAGFEQPGVFVWSQNGVGPLLETFMDGDVPSFVKPVGEKNTYLFLELKANGPLRLYYFTVRDKGPVTCELNEWRITEDLTLCLTDDEDSDAIHHGLAFSGAGEEKISDMCVRYSLGTSRPYAWFSIEMIREWLKEKLTPNQVRERIALMQAAEELKPVPKKRAPVRSRNRVNNNVTKG